MIEKKTPEALLALNKFFVDEENAHIEIDKKICAGCQKKPCLIVCPAALYTLQGEEVSFEYAGCLECGTCRVVCADIGNHGIVKWELPRGGMGIAFRNG